MKGEQTLVAPQDQAWGKEHKPENIKTALVADLLELELVRAQRGARGLGVVAAERHQPAALALELGRVLDTLRLEPRADVLRRPLRGRYVTFLSAGCRDERSDLDATRTS